jgi:hypothetical protein
MTINTSYIDLNRLAPAAVSGGGDSGRKTSVTSGSGNVSENGPVISGISGQDFGKVIPPLFDVRDAVEKLNELAEAQKKVVSYSVDSETHTTVIKFFKSQTGELIKQFPQEEVLALKAHINKNAGWFVDSKK